MSTKGSISLQFNDVTWRAVPLGERVLLLEAPEETPIGSIHAAAMLLEELLGNVLFDLVPAYRSIALFTDADFDLLLAQLANAKQKKETTLPEAGKPIVVPVCYELGEDLESITRHTHLSIEEVIQRHLTPTYTSAFIGFTPGFIYAEGMDPSLTCPRKSEPRKYVSPGTVGIGGSKTGIYSLGSPGGWNLLGRTPMHLFDPNKNPPMLLPAGQSFRFKRITKKEFETWEK